MILTKILNWLRPPDVNDELRRTVEDISFLNNKIRIARQMHSDVIASKMAIRRSALIKKHVRLLEKRRLVQ